MYFLVVTNQLSRFLFLKGVYCMSGKSDVWRIVGISYAPQSRDPEKMNVYLHLERPFADDAAEGMEVNRIFFNPDYVQFEPEVGAEIIPIMGRYGLDRIYRVT